MGATDLLLNYYKLARLITCLFVFSLGHAAAMLDLTQGETIPEDLKTTFNLGATGMRGWFFYDRSNPYDPTVDSRQIQVRAVDAGSPADGFFLQNDVILGASGTSAAPALFVTDARRAIADAINDAEAANPAHLKLIRWRAGEQSIVTLTLRTMGAYSATAPYNCPKSEKILKEGMSLAYNNPNIAGGQFVGLGLLTLLAAQDDMFPDRELYLAKLGTEARALMFNDSMLESIRNYDLSVRLNVWNASHRLITLAEYYLSTGDEDVLPTIEAVAIYFAKGFSHYGTMSHGASPDPYDPSEPYRPMRRGYGAINSPGILALLALQMAKHCGVNDPIVDEKVALSKMYCAAHVGRGTFYYGEEDSQTKTHDDNGKNGLAAMIFENDSVYPEAGKFFTRMAVASADRSRDYGHTGPYFSYLWTPLGVSRGGPVAMQSFFDQVRWQLDLHRRWDGSFAYDSYFENRARNGGEYKGDFLMSTPMLLTYALPLKNLFLTGRFSSGNSALTDQEVRECRDATEYTPADRSIPQLIDDLGSWSPVVREAAARELATRERSAIPIADIRDLVLGGNRESRYGAILALGWIRDAESISSLVDLLNDDDRLVRTYSAKALRRIGRTALYPYRHEILTTFVNRFQPALPPVSEDPLQIDQMSLAKVIFGGGAFANSRAQLDVLLTDLGDKLVYQAIKVTAKLPSGAAWNQLANIYPVLTTDEVLILASELLEVVAKEPHANRRGSKSTRLEVMNVFKKYNIAEAVPAIVDTLKAGDTWDFIDDNMLKTLLAYGHSAYLVTPDPEIVPSIQYYMNRYENILTDAERELSQAIFDEMTAGGNPESLFYLKNIQSVAVDSKVVSLDENSTILRVEAEDLAKGDSVFTWKKLSGPGSVEFVPNGTSEAKNSTVNFNSIPGDYEFEVTMSDSRGFTEVKKAVSVTLTDDLFADAGEDRSILMPLSGVNSNQAKLLLDGIVLNASGQTFSVDWNVESGPESVAFRDVSALKTSATFTEAGEYVLSLTVSDGVTTKRDDIMVTVIPLDSDPGEVVLAGLHYETFSGGIDEVSWRIHERQKVVTDIESEVSSIPTGFTEVFKGQIYDSDGSISFTENIDDQARILIDGESVLSDNRWNTRSNTGNLDLTPGWHDIEIRIGNRNGGGGTFEAPGIGYDPDGGTNWQELNDPGNGSLLRAVSPSAVDYKSWALGLLKRGDANGDGVSNVMAWLSGSDNPLTDSLGLLPVLEVTEDRGYVTYTYRQNYEVELDVNTSIVVQYSSDLKQWTDLVQDGDKIVIKKSNHFYEAGVDKVEVKMKRDPGVDRKYFFRLNVKIRE